MDHVKIIGSKISDIRHERGISMEELAKRCKMPIEVLEQIEVSETLTTLSPLITIARVLGVRLGTFIEDANELGPVVARCDEMANGVMFSSEAEASDTHLDFYPLASRKMGRHMEPFIISVKPLEGDRTEMSAHLGEEFIYVLSGRVEIQYGERTFQLGEGDSIYYDSTVDHHIHAIGSSSAKVLAVIYAPF